MSKRYVAFALSGAIFVVSIASFFVRGLNLGIDFTG
ncbi:MAG: protein translocase subunit SecF, partial [Gammaproteobacteria bacterium]